MELLFFSIMIWIQGTKSVCIACGLKYLLRLKDSISWLMILSLLIGAFVVVVVVVVLDHSFSMMFQTEFP